MTTQCIPNDYWEGCGSYAQWAARERGERPIVATEAEHGHQPLCSILQHEAPKFRQLGTNARQSLTFTDMKGLQKAHENGDVVFFDTLCDLSSPSASYVEYIDYIKHPGLTWEWRQEENKHVRVRRADEMCKAFVVGYSASRCLDTENVVYTPKYEAGEYSPYRKAVSNRSSANRLAAQICKLPDASKIKDLSLIGIDLTFPREISLLYTEKPKDAEKMITRSVKRFMKTMEKETGWVRDDDQKLGAFFNIHVWHSHSDGKEISTPHDPHLHVHLNLVNLVRNKNKSFIRFSPVVDREIINDCWSGAIFRTCGYLVKNPVFYLHFIQLKNRAQLAHRIRYCGRSPLNDLYNYYQDNDFSEDIPRAFNEFLVDYSNPRHTCGFLRNVTEIVGEVEGDRVCNICTHPAEKLEPLSCVEMENLVKRQHIPVAYYMSRIKKVAVIKNEGG